MNPYQYDPYDPNNPPGQQRSSSHPPVSQQYLQTPQRQMVPYHQQSYGNPTAYSPFGYTPQPAQQWPPSSYIQSPTRGMSALNLAAQSTPTASFMPVSPSWVHPNGTIVPLGVNGSQVNLKDALSRSLSLEGTDAIQFWNTAFNTIGQMGAHMEEVAAALLEYADIKNKSWKVFRDYHVGRGPDITFNNNFKGLLAGKIKNGTRAKRMTARAKLTEKGKNGEDAWCCEEFFDFVINAWIDTSKSTCQDTLVKFKNKLPTLSPVTVIARASRRMIMRLARQRGMSDRLDTHITNQELIHVFDTEIQIRAQERPEKTDADFTLNREEMNMAQQSGFWPDHYGIWWKKSSKPIEADSALVNDGKGPLPRFMTQSESSVHGSNYSDRGSTPFDLANRPRQSIEQPPTPTKVPYGALHPPTGPVSGMNIDSQDDVDMGIGDDDDDHGDGFVLNPVRSRSQSQQSARGPAGEPPIYTKADLDGMSHHDLNLHKQFLLGLFSQYQNPNKCLTHRVDRREEFEWYLGSNWITITKQEMNNANNLPAALQQGPPQPPTVPSRRSSSTDHRFDIPSKSPPPGPQPKTPSKEKKGPARKSSDDKTFIPSFRPNPSAARARPDVNLRRSSLEIIPTGIAQNRIYKFEGSILDYLDGEISKSPIPAGTTRPFQPRQCPVSNPTRVHSALWKLSQHDEQDQCTGQVRPIPRNLRAELDTSLKIYINDPSLGDPVETVGDAITDLGNADVRTGAWNAEKWRYLKRGYQFGLAIMSAASPVSAEMYEVAQKFYGKWGQDDYFNFWVRDICVNFAYRDMISFILDEYHSGWLTDQAIFAGLLANSELYAERNSLQPDELPVFIAGVIWTSWEDSGKPPSDIVTAGLDRQIHIAVHVGNNHWCLVVFDGKSNKGYILDSLPDGKVAKKIQVDVDHLWKTLGRLPINWQTQIGSSIQDNLSDCGVHVIANSYCMMIKGLPNTDRITYNDRALNMIRVWRAIWDARSHDNFTLHKYNKPAPPAPTVSVPVPRDKFHPVANAAQDLKLRRDKIPPDPTKG